MTDHLTRRHFVTAASALAGAALLPAAAAAGRAPTGSTDGTVVLFQGDSITDAGRDRSVTDPTGRDPPVWRCGPGEDRGCPEGDRGGARADGEGQAAGGALVRRQGGFNGLARRSTRQSWAADGVRPTPAGHAAIAEQWRRA